MSAAFITGDPLKVMAIVVDAMRNRQCVAIQPHGISFEVTVSNPRSGIIPTDNGSTNDLASKATGREP